MPRAGPHTYKPPEAPTEVRLLKSPQRITSSPRNRWKNKQNNSDENLPVLSLTQKENKTQTNKQTNQQTKRKPPGRFVAQVVSLGSPSAEKHASCRSEPQLIRELEGLLPD